MDEKLVEEIQQNMKSKSTVELLKIQKEDDRQKWPDEAFEAIRRILAERWENLPAKFEEKTKDKTKVISEKLIEDIKKRRRIYLVLFLAMIVAHIIEAFSTARIQAYLAFLILAVVFLTQFLKVIKIVLGYSSGSIVGILLLILLPIPLVPIITIVVLDHKIYQVIRHGGAKPTQEHPQICALAYWSLILFFFPYVGLPMSIFALRKIARSHGTLRGKGIAWAALVINLLFLGTMILGIVLSMR